MKSNIEKSEIINQKKQFIFDVEQSSNTVFPNEKYIYYVYIKNVSGVEIENLKIKIENSPNIVFEVDVKPDIGITLKDREAKLYQFEASCPVIGEHIVHFICYGEETQILYKTLKILCSRTNNSEKLTHRLHIYDFTPYEDIYSFESSNYSDQVTQILKRQKLPYKAGESPFKAISNNVDENTESQSFLDQYNEAKNTNEHVYQYISRESFVEEKKESYDGETLTELVSNINKNSDFFNARLLSTGTNTLLNDFKRFAPDGFIYRMGLLNSEIYHTLGVIPTYSYMSDYLFRWEPPEKFDEIKLYPKIEPKKWGDHLWAGQGWIVYQYITNEYKKTEEFKDLFKEKKISLYEVVGRFEDEKSAQELVDWLEERDSYTRSEQRTDLVKYRYEIRQSLYDTGVFFVNIPINKIPKNFYLMDNDSIMALINRCKPFGTKPIVNYIIEETFNLNMEQKLTLGYKENFLFNIDMDTDDYEIYKQEFKNKQIICEGGTPLTYPAFVTTEYLIHSQKGLFNQEMLVDYDYSQVGQTKSFDGLMEKDVYGYSLSTEKELITLEDVIGLLYQNNFNNICFYIPSVDFISVKEIRVDEDGNIFYLYNEDDPNSKVKIEGVKSINTKELTDEETLLIKIKDSFDKTYTLSIKKDLYQEKDSFIEYIYTNSKGEDFVKKTGYADVYSVSIAHFNSLNKKVLVFFIEDKDRELHYFHHITIQNIREITSERKDKNNIPRDSPLFINRDFFEKKIYIETPFVKQSTKPKCSRIYGGDNWNNFFRFNNEINSYTNIRNMEKDNISVEDIILKYDSINIPETALIKEVRLKLNGNHSKDKHIYLKYALNTEYLSPDLNGYTFQLSPNNIETYSHLYESTVYYKDKLEDAIKKDQESFIEEYKRLIEENEIFNEDINFDVYHYLYDQNDFISIKDKYWCELSEFTNLTYNLNDIQSISLVIEGYNEGSENDIVVQLLDGVNSSSKVTSKTPSGWFREKIPLLYPNSFKLENLRARFRFKDLTHTINIFDTKLEITFKNKQSGEIDYIPSEILDLNNSQTTVILNDYINPADLNNGLNLVLQFDDLAPGDYYQLYSHELEIIYQENDIDVIISNNNYENQYFGINPSQIQGHLSDGYLSGLFYSDVAKVIQDESNIGPENKGIKLEDALYQKFESRDDNITCVEIFPHGFVGNPNSSIKIGLYTNSNNTPDSLIKEIVVDGWLKNNEELKSLKSIKYNFNVDNLIKEENYWLKLEVMNPEVGNYYMLKGTTNGISIFKLLARDNNNYINTLSSLKFNIYSENLSQSFCNINAFQENFDNPYIKIGLHKGKGIIDNLKIMKKEYTITRDDYMGEIFDDHEAIVQVSIKAKYMDGREVDLINNNSAEGE